MSAVSRFQANDGPKRRRLRSRARGGYLSPPDGQPSRSRRRPLVYALIGTAVVLVAVIAAGAVALTATPSVSADAAALAQLRLPFGTGTVKTLSVVGGREQRLIPVRVSGGRIWPTQRLGVHERVTIVAVTKRPGWISWLAGPTQTVRVTFLTPGTRLRSHYLTVPKGRPLTLAFTTRVALFESGQRGHLRHSILAAPEDHIQLPTAASAGSMWVAAAPRTWEAPRPAIIDWFPAGTAASAIANPAPGSKLTPDSSITLTFSKPVAQVLDGHLPPLTPATQGGWRTINAHSISFQPQGYGYGLGAKVSVALPVGVQIIGGTSHGSDPSASWSVPPGSTLRLQQLLATLGYLPLRFTSSANVASTVSGQEAAAVAPPAGTFSWRYPNVPSQLRSMWQPGASGVVTRGAVMAFENAHGLPTDGVAGPQVWKSLISATLAGSGSSFGYTFVHVSEGSPESIDVWHSGRTVVTGPVNTGIAAAPTATGTFAVFEHALSVTMSGFNPDGSHYSDPGVPYVSYFNGGDALHGFIRASYGSPQSLGCVEMPYSEAARVYPYTPIGTLVNVT
jgi:peptidoglycan hydrolase-like protein with peptidoglycan-binding domain